MAETKEPVVGGRNAGSPGAGRRAAEKPEQSPRVGRRRRGGAQTIWCCFLLAREMGQHWIQRSFWSM